MNVTSITWDMVVLVVGVVLCALAGYNTFATARKNRREEEARRNQPTAASIREIMGTLESHASKLASDKARLDNIDRVLNEMQADSRDIHAAQEALCYGVQSLLEHALHNGNDGEMQSASKELNRYLRSRRFAHDEE